MDSDLKEKSLQLIKHYSDDPESVELLHFFARHPYTRFSRLAIRHGLNNENRSKTQTALQRLIEDKLLCIQNQNNILVYYLTDDTLRREIVCSLAAYDIAQWKSITKVTQSQLQKNSSKEKQRYYFNYFYRNINIAPAEK
jgi:hypothetical protein